MQMLCGSIFPGQTDLCSSMVDLYAPTIFQQLEAALQPDPVCQGIHFCPPQPSVVVVLPVAGSRAAPSSWLQRAMRALGIAASS